MPGSPSSRTMRLTVDWSPATRTSIRVAFRACRRALVTASWAIRKTAASIAAGGRQGHPRPSPLPAARQASPRPAARGRPPQAAGCSRRVPRCAARARSHASPRACAMPPPRSPPVPRSAPRGCSQRERALPGRGWRWQRRGGPPLSSSSRAKRTRSSAFTCSSLRSRALCWERTAQPRAKSDIRTATPLIASATPAQLTRRLMVAGTRMIARPATASRPEPHRKSE